MDSHFLSKRLFAALLSSSLIVAAPSKSHADEPITVALIGAGGTIIAAAIIAYASGRSSERELLNSDSDADDAQVIDSEVEEPANVASYSAARFTPALNAETGDRSTYLSPEIDVVQVADVLRAQDAERVSYFVGYEMVLEIENEGANAESCVTLGVQNLTLATVDVPGTYGESSFRVQALQDEEVTYEQELVVRQGEPADTGRELFPDRAQRNVGALSVSGSDISIPCALSNDSTTALLVRVEFSGFGERI